MSLLRPDAARRTSSLLAAAYFRCPHEGGADAPGISPGKRRPRDGLGATPRPLRPAKDASLGVERLRETQHPTQQREQRLRLSPDARYSPETRYADDQLAHRVARGRGAHRARHRARRARPTPPEAARALRVSGAGGGPATSRRASGGASGRVVSSSPSTARRSPCLRARPRGVRRRGRGSCTRARAWRRRGARLRGSGSRPARGARPPR
jgi:hypothetical protein